TEPKQIKHVAEGEWMIVLDSAEAQWGGNGAAAIENNTVSIQGESILILTNQKNDQFIVTV
ncbi:MAG TPA: hypothetical protein VGB71_08740, partial [Flavisolibacter sp.]